MDVNNRYRELKNSILGSFDRIAVIKDENEMSKPYVDSFTTKEQRSRDKQVTKLLSLYVKGYESKVNSNKWYKLVLLIMCSLILLGFSIIFGIIIINVVFSKKVISIASLCQLISVCITFLTLIIGTLNIIVKYVFPEDDEKYITSIVEIIQNNDLENKKENIKAQVEISKSKENESNNDIDKEIDDI